MVDADRHHRLRTAYHCIMDVAIPERRARLDEVCRLEPDLRDELESLLSFVDNGDDLDAAAATLRTSWREQITERPERVGRYRLLHEIGAGGMGVVYLAEQEHPRRTVAVKMLRSALATERRRRRFERESEILGRLDHPGIARILEAGSEHDHPYFVMEFVDGRPVTNWAREENLTVAERVRLLVELCDAVAHAHQRGVVHRDLKPGNVLVTGDGRVRVLDFGVARASDVGDLETLETGEGELMGTLPYMSPEQLEGSPDVDVRADVYAIGVMAYEVLGGRRPIELASMPLPSAIRRVLETDPEPLGAVDPELAGDLEIITGKSMTRARDRRYANVVELGADLRRWLDHEPITARPPSSAYQLHKFAQRNRGVVVACIVIFMLLVVGITAMSIVLYETNQQRLRAFEAKTDASAQRDAARRAGDATRRQRDAYLSVLAFSDLDQARTTALVRGPATAGELDAVLGHAFAARGWFVDAISHVLRALEHHDPRDAEGLVDLLWLSVQIDDTAEFSLRGTRWREHADALLRSRQPTLADAVLDLHELMPDDWSREYDPIAAARAFRALVTLVEMLRDDDLSLQLVADRLAWIAERFSVLQAHDQARILMSAALQMRRRHLLETSPRVLWGRVQLLEIIIRQGDHRAAEREARAALETLAQVLPRDHLLLAMFRARLGRALVGLQQYDEGIALMREAVPDLERGIGLAGRDVARTLGDLILALKAAGRGAEAAPLSDYIVAAVAAAPHRRFWFWTLMNRLGPQHAQLHTAVDRAMRVRQWDQIDEPFDLFFDVLHAHAEPDEPIAVAMANVTMHWLLIWIRAGGWSVHTQGILDEVERIVRAAPTHPLMIADLCELGIMHAARAGDLQRAERYYREGMAVVEAQRGRIDSVVPALDRAWGEALLNHGRPADGLPRLEASLDTLRTWRGETGYATRWSRVAVSTTRHAMHDEDVAVADEATLRAALAEPLPRPRLLEAAAWMVARTPGRDRAAYADALDAATRAYEIMPDTWLITRTLALARMRAGDDAGAIEAARLTREGGGLLGDRPELWSIEAVAHARLGAAGEARYALERAESLVAQAEFRFDYVSRRLLEEARPVVTR